MNTPESLKHTKWECKYHIVWIPKYRNWPISIFLKEELDNPRLPSLTKVIPGANKIHIKLERDAWRVRKRPPIKEKNIAGSGTLLSELTEKVWSDMLKQAMDCLNSDKSQKPPAKPEA